MNIPQGAINRASYFSLIIASLVIIFSLLGIVYWVTSQYDLREIKNDRENARSCELGCLHIVERSYSQMCTNHVKQWEDEKECNDFCSKWYFQTVKMPINGRTR